MKRTVITGIGVVAPGGSSRKAFWNLLTDGRTATRRISMFDPAQFRSQIAGECDFDPLQAGLSRRDVFRNDRFVQFALAAATEAVADSGLELDGDEQGRVGVSIGSAVGSTTRLENEYVNVSNNGADWIVDPRYATTFLQQALVPSSAATEVACRFGTHGPATVISTGCTSGIDALGYGHQLIQDGEADIVTRVRRMPRSRPSRSPASTQSGPRPAGMMNRPRRPGRSTRVGTASSSARVLPSWCWRNSRAQGGVVRASTPR